MTIDEFFAGWNDSRKLFEALRVTVEALGPVKVRVGTSQIAFSRRVAFAWVWIPGRYLRDTHAPLVLTLSLHRREMSPRWKEIVEPAPGRFTHHLELHASGDIDDEVVTWLQEAWQEAA